MCGSAPFVTNVSANSFCEAVVESTANEFVLNFVVLCLHVHEVTVDIVGSGKVNINENIAVTCCFTA